MLCKNCATCYNCAMPADFEAVRAYFAKLGLETAIADLYVALHAYGPQTITQLARHSGVERTRIYRLLDTLLQHNLAEVESQYKRSLIKAAPILNLQILISQKEQELEVLERELVNLHRNLPQPPSSHATRVQFYHGAEGNKQMYWNETHAQTEVLCILYENIQIKTNSKFFERWVRRCNERDIKSRGIIGDHFIDSQQEWYDAHTNERLKHWESRYIAPEVFPITHSTVTYNNTVAYYNWRNGEIFGIEIYNQEIADAQSAFFEMLWAQGKTKRMKLGDQENAMP